ncbi:hypothetical protein ACOMHN_065657 [Nucella lapillus]
MASGGLSTKPAPMPRTTKPPLEAVANSFAKHVHGHESCGSWSTSFRGFRQRLCCGVRPVGHSLASCPRQLTQQREPQAEMLMELYLEHYPEHYDEVMKSLLGVEPPASLWTLL